MVAFRKAGWERNKIKRWKSLVTLLAARGLLGQEDGLDVGQYASLSDGHALEQLVQLLVVADGELEVAGVDPLLLVVAGGVAGQLENLSGQVLHDGGEVDWSTGAHPLGVVA